MITKQIASWKALWECFEEVKNENVIFRGVTRDNYELIPRVGRQETIKGGWDEESENQILLRFRIRARPILDAMPEGHRHSDWIVTGQHHGLPTRLLDWTFNPLVATFFAVDWSGTETSAAIYMEKLSGGATTEVEDIFEVSEITFLYPHHITPRITAQKGFFTVHPNPTSPYDSDNLVKFLIPFDLRIEIQQTLRHYGIDRSSLFPDLDGIASDIAWNFQWSRR